MADREPYFGDLGLPWPGWVTIVGCALLAAIAWIRMELRLREDARIRSTPPVVETGNLPPTN